ncbi:MAG TPA: hypothetical protein VFF03_04535 [Rhodocyclaceae bacterium]|nr:hypothetical protein [Rhodocyclaceae bacterium]
MIRISASLRRAAGCAALALAAQSAGAQSILDFDIWMQKIDASSQSFFRNLARRDVQAGAADARELARLYRLMEGYYEKRGNADDAVLSSYFGREKAADAARALEGKDFDTAFAAVTDIARDCPNCHRYKPL